MTRRCKGIFSWFLLCTRSSWKYKNRAFRYCLLDAGHLLGSIEAAALLKKKSVTVAYNIERTKLNRMFGFEEREWFLAGVVMAEPIAGTEVSPIEFELPYVDGSGTFEKNKLIEQAYNETIVQINCKAQNKTAVFDFNTTKLQDTLLHRRSQRGFNAEPITTGQFNMIRDAIHQPVTSDCDEDVSIYMVLNRVINMPLGLYKDGVYIKHGDFAKHAGYLSLEQYSLSQQGAVAFFLTSKSQNYQAMYQKAGIIGHRLYVVSQYLGVGCSGIGAYYDDEVNTFVDNDEMVLYALAIGT